MEGGHALEGSRLPTLAGCTRQRKEETQFESFIHFLDKIPSSVALELRNSGGCNDDSGQDSVSWECCVSKGERTVLTDKSAPPPPKEVPARDNKR